MRFSPRCADSVLMRLLFYIALSLLVIPVESQTVTDEDRRGFDDLRPLHIDVDSDGKPDRIQPRTYQTYKRRGSQLLFKDITNWITFDLATTRGRTIRSFYTYKYGTALNGDSYWVYALIPICDVNRDGKTDLLFYSGDDTSDETVILLNRGNRFVVHSRKVQDSGDWGRNANAKRICPN